MLVELKNLREARHLSFQQFKIRGGLNKSAVHKIENGVSIPRVDTVCKLAKVLSMDPVELFKILIQDEPWSK